MTYIKRSILVYLLLAFLNLLSNPYLLAQKVTFQAQKLPIVLKTINALKVEDTKILWIASGNGLFKLENKKIRKYTNLPDGEKLQVNAIEIDEHGSKWLGTYSGKLIKFKNGKISASIDFNEYLKPDNSIVTSIAISDNKSKNDSKILLTTSDGQIFYYDTLKLKKGKLKSPVKNMVYSINYGHEKTTWLCTSDGFFIKNLGNRWKQKQDLYLSYGIFKSFGNYWAVGRDKEKKAVFMLYYHNAGSASEKYVWKEFQLKKLPNKYARFYEVASTTDSYAWITSDIGLIRYNTLSASTKLYNQKKNKSFKIKSTRHIAVQNRNTIWISSSGRDLYKLTLKY